VSEIPAPIERFVQATNSGDHEAFVSAFSSDAYLEDWGRKFHGHEGVRSWDASDNIGKHSHFEVVSAHEDAGDWVVTVDVSGEGFTGRSDLRFTLDGDLISRMVIAP
jgi:SnoaL-like domain